MKRRADRYPTRPKTCVLLNVNPQPDPSGSHRCRRRTAYRYLVAKLRPRNDVTDERGWERGHQFKRVVESDLDLVAICLTNHLADQRSHRAIGGFPSPNATTDTGRTAAPSRPDFVAASSEDGGFVRLAMAPPRTPMWREESSDIGVSLVVPPSVGTADSVSTS